MSPICNLDDCDVDFKSIYINHICLNSSKYQDKLGFRQEKSKHLLERSDDGRGERSGETSGLHGGSAQSRLCSPAF